MTAIKSVVADAKRIVIKVGTALLTDNGRGLDEKAIANLAEELSAVQKLGREVVLVSSGSIAEGVRRLGWERRPTEVGQLQAAAAVGQMGLAQAYETEFAKRGVKTAQILLTGADLADRTRYLNARSALLTLLSLGVVPVINENDTVVTDEIKVGDNDTLGSVVTNLIEADAPHGSEGALHGGSEKESGRGLCGPCPCRRSRFGKDGRRRRKLLLEGRHDHEGDRGEARRSVRRVDRHRLWT